MTPDALAAQLTRPWAHGEHAALPGVRCDAAVVLDGLTLRSFDLSDSRFAHGLTARGSRFRGMAWLKRARIDGVCDLSGASFRSDLRLDGLICDRLALSGARFEGVLDLDGARIGTLHLDDTLCLANVSLGRARIDALDLTGAALMGGLWAEGARIGQAATGGLEIEGRAHAV
jgi:uncharacterized protein YjbI with pentapeptide repeats